MNLQQNWLKTHIPIAKVVRLENKHGFVEHVAQENQPLNSKLDRNFPHSSQSIAHGMSEDLHIKWIQAQSLCDYPNYSLDIDNLQQPCFVNKSVTHALLALNWFSPEHFDCLFAERPIKPQGLLGYRLMINGQLTDLWIDTYIPIKGKFPIFADNVRNSIFPCLYEKLLAKVFTSYENISTSLVDLLQLLTHYLRETIPFYALQPPSLHQRLERNVENGDIVLFRTRNSVRLETVGLISDHEYIITRFLTLRGKFIAQFLEIDGMSWIGKHSKLRAFWAFDPSETQAHQINTSEHSRENFIELSDLIGVTRQFVVLHNTMKSHKYCYHSANTHSQDCFQMRVNGNSTTNVKICVNLMHRQCRSLMLLVNQDQPTLLAHSFKLKKSTNFIQADLEPNNNYFLFVYAEDITTQSANYNVTMCSSPSQIVWGALPISPALLHCQDTALIHHLSRFAQGQLKVTYILNEHAINCYIKSKFVGELGLGLVLINLDADFGNCKIRVQIDPASLHQQGFSLINTKATLLQYCAPLTKILVFHARNVKEGDLFPPKPGFFVSVLREGSFLYSIFN